MKKIILSLVSVFAFAASASDVAVVWGSPDFSQEFIQNAVIEHVDIYQGEKESRYSTEVAARLVRSGAKTISSIGVTQRNGSATAIDFADGLRAAAERSRIVLSTVGPINGQLICDVIREFNDRTVFVFTARRGDVNCGSWNTLPVFNDGYNFPGAFTAGDLSNFAMLHPELSGASLLRGYRMDRPGNNALGASASK